MPYNKYNIRMSRRYNTPGNFVSAGVFTGGPRLDFGIMEAPQIDYTQAFNKPISQPSVEQYKNETNMEQNLETTDATQQKQHWMKSKLAGVKKISNKERRRRQNENLRRLLSPKNALMVLNEIMPGEQLANQFKVQSVTGSGGNLYCKPSSHNFCAEINVEGINYVGYGENKLVARNNAADQAIRDLMIKRMGKLFGDGSETEGTEGDEASLPMIQLASYALHKLFSEWECEGHKVPQLRPFAPPAPGQEADGSGASAEAGAEAGPEVAARAPAPAKVRLLPGHAAAMHPCMLLSYMRPQLEYRELPARGATPQTMVFTMAIDVDGVTYLGKAGSKKEARKQAAKAACEEIFKVKFEYE